MLLNRQWEEEAVSGPLPRFWRQTAALAKGAAASFSIYWQALLLPAYPLAPSAWYPVSFLFSIQYALPVIGAYIDPVHRPC